VLLWFAASAIAHLRDPQHISLLGGVIFGAHEFGHLFFGFFGEFVAVLGGSVMQLLIPIGAAAALAGGRDWFGVACAFCLLGASCGHLSGYVADARAMDLDLVSFSPEGAIHDWHYLLSHWGLLREDQFLARLVRVAGSASTAVGVVLGGWLLTQMRSLRVTPPEQP
jgi:hypothetical protein